MFINSLDNKRYYTLNYFFKNKFNQKVFKVPLDAGFGCPNTKGCIYCKNKSKANIIKNSDSLIKQFYQNVEILEKKWPNSLYIPYFQAGTNTNEDVEHLKALFEPFLLLPKVVGLNIATRPDAINDDVLEYLNDLNKRTFLILELGLQSSNDDTLKLIKRGHNKDCFESTLKNLQKRNIFTIAHIINGLPYETEKDMINTAKYLNDLSVDGIKIHMLYISRDTKIEELYCQEKFHILDKDEYIDIVIKQLEVLNKNIIIARITGDPDKKDLVAPSWLLKKFIVLNDIDKEMVKRNTYQGINI